MTRVFAGGGRLAWWLLAMAIVVATFAVYWPGLEGGFIFDDFQNLVMNPALRVAPGSGSWIEATFSSPSSDLQRPLSMLSFAINHYFTGFDARAMKLTNIGIHALNALLVLVLARRLVARAYPGRAPLPAAGFTALAWAVHPINLMAVLYVVQRMESLSHTFVLLGLIAYCIGRERTLAGRRGGWLLVGGGLIGGVLLGVGAKETAVLLPLYAFALELVLYRFEQADGRRERLLVATYLVLLLVPALLGGSLLLSRAVATGAFGMRDFGPWERLLTEGRVLLDYLRWSVVPDLGSLSLYHDDYPVSRAWFDPPASLPAWLFLVALAFVAWKLRRRFPLAALGYAWFLCAHSLTAGFVNLDLVYEHRNYFASIGICLALAELLLLVPAASRRPLAGAIAACFLGFLALTTTLRANEWSNPLRFAESEAAKHPASPRATYEAARMLIIAGNYDPASPYTQKAGAAVERAMQVRGGGTLPAQAALVLGARLHRPLDPRWWQQLQERVARNPGAPESQLSLIAMTSCASSGDCLFPPEDMMRTFQAGLSKGDDAGVLSVYGTYALHVLHDEDFAFRLWQEAARLSPGNAQFQANLAWLAIGMGRYEVAEDAIAAMRRLGRFGQHSRNADALEAQLRKRRSAPSAPSS